MACSNCNCTNNTTCGCKDTPLTTAPVYTCPPDIKCPDPTPCYETIQDTCVKHGNYSIINFGKLLAGGDAYPALPAGASLENAFQAMSVNLVNTDCLPPINVHPSYIGTTTLTVSWEDTGADYYNFTIGTNPGGPFSPSVVNNATSYTITNLTPATTYYIKIESYCNSGTDYSFGATIAVTTLGVL